MSQAQFTFRTVKSPEGNYEICTHSIARKESRQLSKFQALGLLLRWADALREDESDFGRSIGAVFGFDVEVAALGFEPYDPVHILTAPSWKIRMFAAWCVLGSAERTKAVQLDYDDLHNYWPNTDFCSPDWDAEVKQWVANGASYNAPIELRMARVTRNHSRPQLVFKV